MSEIVSNTAYCIKSGAKRARRAYVISESSIAVKPRMYVRIFKRREDCHVVSMYESEIRVQYRR